MASLPAPPSSQRRSNQSQTSSMQSQPARESTHTQSHDSQTIFAQTHEEDESSQEQQQPAPPLGADNLDKKCWICFSDASEDTPETSPWRDPCPCALVAHEECLLDWIADMEAPKNSRNRSVTAPKIECPQCKSEIKLARPTDYIVDAIRSVERVGVKLATPGAIFTISSMLYSSSMAWGAHSIYAVFGAEDGHRILQPIIYNSVRAPIETYIGSPANAGKQLIGAIAEQLVHWRLFVGLPLITPVLILSRTTFADGIIPVLPIVFFASQTPPHGVIDLGQWPPSASFVFAILPYARSIYNAYYERVWAKWEKKWLLEIQPRAGQNQSENPDAEAGGDPANNGEGRDEGDNVFEVRIDGGIWEEWHDDAGAAAAQQPQPQPANNDDNPVPPANPDDENAGLLPAAAAAPAAQGENAPPLVQQPPPPAAAAAQPQPAAAAPPPQAERRLSFSPTAIAESILGALIFPTIAGLAGEALKLVLPLSWTTPASSAAMVSSRFGGRALPRGLLQQKWGRSVVGGCLFVVCKDALMLYVRWRMAQMHRRRRVVDYDREGKGKGRGR